MKFGIIITSYNDEKTLENAIQSVARFKKKNIYIAIVDDCSTDSTINILKHAKKNNLINIFHINKKNLGAASSRNIGINLCKNSDYITFLDADDIILPNFFNIINKTQLRGDLIAFNFKYSLKEKISPGQNFYKIDRKLEVKDIKEYFLKYLIKPNKYSLFTTCWAKLYKTKILLLNKDLYFNEKMLICEDTDFVFRFLAKAKKINYINKSIYLHKLGTNEENLNKLTFGVNLNNSHQISFLRVVESCTNYFIKNGHTLAELQPKIDHCIGCYIIIYIIRSCLKINSIPSFKLNYLFWKNFFTKNVAAHLMNNYSHTLAGGGWLLPFLIRKKMFFFVIFFAYLIARKRYL